MAFKMKGASAFKDTEKEIPGWPSLHNKAHGHVEDDKDEAHKTKEFKDFLESGGKPKSGFKMKGSPMHRNFGIGESPILKTALQHTVDDVEEHQFEHSEDLQTDEEHDRHHWPDGTKRTEREISEYDETKNEESKEGGDETSVLEEGRTEPPLKHTWGTQYENEKLTDEQKEHNATPHPEDHSSPSEKSSGTEYSTGGTLNLSSRGGGWKSGNNKT